MPKAKKQSLTQKERLIQALVPEDEQPYGVPDNWTWTRLGKILDMQSGKFINAKSIFQDDDGMRFPCYGGNGLRGYVDIFNTVGTFPIVGRQGALCGNIHLANGKYYATEHAVVVKPIENVDVHWANYALIELNLNQYSTATAQPGLAVSKIANVPVPLPPLGEQHRIASHIERLFEKLDRAKTLVQSALDSFENRKAAILHKAFTGELTAIWREENSVKLEQWEKKSARDVCGFITKGETPTKFVANTGDIPFLKVYNIRENKLDFDYNPSFIPLEIHKEKMKRSVVYPGDVIMNIVGPPLQKVAIVTDQYSEWNINQAIAIFRPTASIIGKFLYHVLLWENTLAEVLGDVRGVVGQSNISLEQCRDLQIPIPHLDEQKEIVRILESLLESESKAQEMSDTIEKIDHMKKAILARAFRGELGTNDPNEESAKKLLLDVVASLKTTQ